MSYSCQTPKIFVAKYIFLGKRLITGHKVFCYLYHYFLREGERDCPKINKAVKKLGSFNLAVCYRH